MSGETDVFIKQPQVVAAPSTSSSSSCCEKKATLACCVASAAFGVVFVGLGLVALFLGKPFFEDYIINSMALTPGSDRFESWLRPPVQPHLYGYAFHVTNHEAVLRGAKPIVEERGPYVYKSTTVKDSDDNIAWNDDGTMTYRPRKVYVYEPSLSGEGLDPFNDFIVVPNIPLWTGLNKAKGSAIGRQIVLDGGLGTPFGNVTFNGLLWGYNDELPCLKLDRPKECGADANDPFADDGDDAGQDYGFGDEDDEWGDWKRKKRNAEDPNFDPSKDPNSVWYGKAKNKADFVNCSCEWGLFRDRNITMRKPIRFMTGVDDLGLKGIVTEYDGEKELNWWKKGSQCDAVKGQDSSTLPPQIQKEQKLEIYIALMCRTIMMEFEKVKIATVIIFGLHDSFYRKLTTRTFGRIASFRRETRSALTTIPMRRSPTPITNATASKTKTSSASSRACTTWNRASETRTPRWPSPCRTFIKPTRVSSTPLRA